MTRLHSSLIDIEKIESVLPQTQCGKCGYEGCQPYAEAIVSGESIDRCTPGGQAVMRALGEMTKQPVPHELHPYHRLEIPPHIVSIREDLCIGCTKCIQACPMDAIVGSAKQMHTVIAKDCTGCDLCIAPCPVDCIESIPLDDQASKDMLSPERLARNKALFDRRKNRLVMKRKSSGVSLHSSSVKTKVSEKTNSISIKPARNITLALKAMFLQKKKLEKQSTSTKNITEKNRLLEQIKKLENNIVRANSLSKRMVEEQGVDNQAEHNLLDDKHNLLIKSRKNKNQIDSPEKKIREKKQY